METKAFTRRVVTGLVAALTIGVASTAWAQQPLVLRIGHNTPVGSPTDLGMKYFAKIVKERSGGKIEIRDYPAKIEAVTPEQVQQVLAELIHPSKLVIVTTGPGNGSAAGG